MKKKSLKISILTIIIILLVYILYPMFMLHPIVSRIHTHVVGDLGDPVYINYIMGWNYYKLSTGLEGYWDTNFFYPFKSTLAFSEHSIGMGLLAFPLIKYTGEYIFTCNILLIFGYISSAIVVYSIVFYFTRNHLSGFMAGIVYSFSPFFQNYKGHLIMTNAQAVPLTLFFTMLYMKKGKVIYLALAVFSFIFGFLTNNHTAAFLFLITPTWGLVYFVKYKRYQHQRTWIALFLAALVIVSVTLPIFTTYFNVVQRYNFERSIKDLEHYSPETRSYITLPRENYLYNKLLASVWQLPPRTPNKFYGSVYPLFPGLVATFLAIFSMVRFRYSNSSGNNVGGVWWGILKVFLWIFILLSFCRSNERYNYLFLSFLALILVISIYTWLRKGSGFRSFDQKVLFIFMICILVLSQGPYIFFHGEKIFFNPYIILYKWIPGFSGIRIVTRLMSVFIFCFSVLVGFGMKRLIELFRSRKTAWIVPVVLIITSLLEYWTTGTHLSRVPGATNVPSVYKWISRQPGNYPVLEYPMSFLGDMLTVYYSLYHHKPLVNGYSGFTPPFFVTLRKMMRHFPSRETFQILRSMGIKYLILDMEKPSSHHVLKEIMSMFKNELETTSVKGSSSRVCLILKNPGKNFLDLERLMENITLPNRVIRGFSINLNFYLELLPGEILINPEPAFNPGFSLTWRNSDGKCVLKRDLRNTFPHFINSNVPYLKMQIPVPEHKGKHYLEIRPLFQDKILRIHEIEIY